MDSPSLIKFFLSVGQWALFHLSFFPLAQTSSYATLSINQILDKV